MRQAVKNFFIPHAGNNFHPHVLHSKRAIFYSTVFITMKLLVFSTAVLLPLEVYVFPDVIKAEQEKIVGLTNSVRADHGKSPLVSNHKLEQSSESKVQDMVANQYFSHVSPNGKTLTTFLRQQGYPYHVAGENLAIGFSSAQEVVNAWVQSPTHFSNLIDADYLEVGASMASGVYNSENTVYVAQHFGVQKQKVKEENVVIETNNSEESPKSEKEEEESEKNSTNTPKIIENSSSKDNSLEIDLKKEIKAEVAINNEAVLSEEVTSKDDKTIVYQNDNSFVEWTKNDRGTKIYAEAIIAGSPTEVKVSIKDIVFPLFLSTKQGVYTGNIDIKEDYTYLFSPVITPSITIIDSEQNITNEFISWKNPVVISPTPIQKYKKAKESLAPVTLIFRITDIMYFGFAIFFAIVLLLNIFIELKKQHHHVTAQTISLILLLMILFTF